MKVIIVAVAALALGFTPWLTDFDQAKRQAKDENRMILLSFSGSDWCAPCIKMKKEVFESTAFQEFAGKRLVLLRADFPRHKKNQLEAKQKDHNEKLADLYNPHGKFPLTCLLDSDGKVIMQWDGYSNMTSDAFMKQLYDATNGK